MTRFRSRAHVVCLAAATAALHALFATSGFNISTRAQSNSAPEGSWPGLWGPARSGAVEQMTVGALKEVWRRPTAGGYSEIAAVGDRVVTLELRNGEDFVVALDAASGRELWSARIGPTYRGHGGSDDGPIATPMIDGGDVFATGPHGHLLALDAATGKERWRHDLVQEFGASVPQWGFGSSPLVYGQLVIVPTGGAKSRGLLAFDRVTGRLTWNAPHMRTPVYSSAVPAVIGGMRQIVVAAGDRTFAVSPGDGALLWSAAGPGGSIEVANSPVILPDDRVLLTYWQEAVMLKITRTDGAFAASELWRSTTPRGSNGPTIFRDGFLYGFAGPLIVCVDAATGQVRWRERTGEGTLVGAGSNLLFLGQTSGEVRVIRASPDGFAESSRTRVFAPDVRSVTGPSLANGRLYVRNLKEMAAFSVSVGPTQESPQKHPEIAALEQQIAGKEKLPAEQVWKNIELFKGRPAIAVLRVMEQAFVANLGVECSYCHVEKQYESDEKNAKKIARNMWTMRAEWQAEARKASGNDEAVVTCYTCHKGQPKPAFAPER